MQLIMDSETTTNINDKMTTLDETLDTNLKDSINTIKNEIINSNKENIESKKNTIENALDAVNGDNLKPTDDTSETPSATTEKAIKIDKQIENIEIKTEEILTEQNFCNTNKENGIQEQDACVSDEIEQTNVDKNSVNGSEVEIDIKEESTIHETIISEENNVRNNSVKLEASQESENVKVLEGIEDSVNQLNVENTSLSNKEDTNMDMECGDSAKEKTIPERDTKETEGIKSDFKEAILDNEINHVDTKPSEAVTEKPILECESNNDAETVQSVTQKVVLEEDSNMDTETVQSDTQKVVLEEDSNMDTETVQSVTQKVVLEEDGNMDTETVKSDTKQLILGENSSMEIDHSEANSSNPEERIMIDHSQNSNVIFDTKAEDIAKSLEIEHSDLTMDTDDAEITGNKIKTDNKEIDKIEKENDTITTKLKVSDSHPVEMKENKEVRQDIDVLDVETAETSKNDAVTKTLQILDTELDESDVQDNTVVLDDSNNKNEGKTLTEMTNNKDDVLEINTDETDKTSNESVQAIPQKSTSPTPIKNLETISVDDAVIVPENDSPQKKVEDKEEILDIDQFLRDTEVVKEDTVEIEDSEEPDKPVKEPILKLSNTLDILSDDDEEPTPTEAKNTAATVTTTISTEKQCINIEDDDDIMLIDEDTDSKDSKSETAQPLETGEKKEQPAEDCTIDLESTEIVENKKGDADLPNVLKESSVPENKTEPIPSVPSSPIKPEEIKEQKVEEPKKPLLAENVISCKKNLADMTRNELEDFCITKIMEGIVDRCNLGDIKSKLKAMAQNIEEYKKKAMMLAKQNRDLQLVLKSVQEEQKKKSDTAIIPLKITRSVGMQVLMTEKPNLKKKTNSANNKNANARNSNQNARQKVPVNSQHIPVPRLVPAVTNLAVKTPNNIIAISQTTNTKTSQSGINGMKVTTSPVQKIAEKRTFNRTHAVTVDLTEDEPPTKITPKSSPAPPVRLVSPQNLLTRPQFTSSTVNSPRKVYIPISGPQGQNIRPGQTIMLKSVPPPGQRMRGPAPHSARLPQNQVRLTRVANSRHPAPLPECMKQYQPPNWKALPPAPDLKLSKVENGIVISWKIEGYQDDSYEEIASYQLYAYQETSSPPNTALWKKIGDVKALPLPMACTLTQFLAGFKYYFAVRAVDIRSRLGPFSLPGSILLLNKI